MLTFSHLQVRVCVCPGERMQRMRVVAGRGVRGDGVGVGVGASVAARAATAARAAPSTQRDLLQVCALATHRRRRTARHR